MHTGQAAEVLVGALCFQSSGIGGRPLFPEHGAERGSIQCLVLSSSIYRQERAVNTDRKELLVAEVLAGLATDTTVYLSGRGS